MAESQVPAGDVGRRLAGTAPRLIRSDISTADPEIAHEFITATYANHQPILSGDREEFRFHARVLQEARFGVERLRHTMGLDTEIDPYGALIALHVRRGQLRMNAHETEIRARPGDVVLAGPAAQHHVWWDEIDVAVVRLDVAAVQQVAAEVTDAPGGRIRFDLCQPIDPARAAHWLGAVQFLTTSVLDAPAVANNPIIRTQAFRTLAVAALNTFPNSTMRGDFSPHAVNVTPAAVTRAIEFIEAEADHEITVSDIAAAAGVSPRTIQLAFRRHRDLTPMAYLRQVRLQRAHADLRSGDPAATTVAAIASRWGFLHGGYFARIYQQEYGCLPLDTLRS